MSVLDLTEERVAPVMADGATQVNKAALKAEKYWRRAWREKARWEQQNKRAEEMQRRIVWHTDEEWLWDRLAIEQKLASSDASGLFYEQSVSSGGGSRPPPGLENLQPQVSWSLNLNRMHAWNKENLNAGAGNKAVKTSGSEPAPAAGQALDVNEECDSSEEVALASRAGGKIFWEQMTSSALLWDVSKLQLQLAKGVLWRTNFLVQQLSDLKLLARVI